MVFLTRVYTPQGQAHGLSWAVLPWHTQPGPHSAPPVLSELSPMLLLSQPGSDLNPACTQPAVPVLVTVVTLTQWLCGGRVMVFPFKEWVGCRAEHTTLGLGIRLDIRRIS